MIIKPENKYRKKSAQKRSAQNKSAQKEYPKKSTQKRVPKKEYLKKSTQKRVPKKECRKSVPEMLAKWIRKEIEIKAVLCYDTDIVRIFADFSGIRKWV